MSEGITCYEQDEELCADEMCLRTGCQLKNARLAAAGEQKPFAWHYELLSPIGPKGCREWRWYMTRVKPDFPDSEVRHLTPLYAGSAPQPAPGWDDAIDASAQIAVRYCVSPQCVSSIRALTKSPVVKDYLTTRLDDKELDVPVRLTVVSLEGRIHCAYINDHRIAGGKPWAGGTTEKEWNTSLREVIRAFPDLQKTLGFDYLGRPLRSSQSTSDAGGGVGEDLDDLLGDAATLRGFIKTHKMTPSMMASERDIWKLRCEKAESALSNPAAADSNASADPFVHGAEDEAYALGRRDGYEGAIQDLDIASGGDGEFKGSTIPGETVDVETMKQRIIDRLANASAEARLREDNMVGLTDLERTLLIASKAAQNYIANTESELGMTLKSGDLLRAAIAKSEACVFSSTPNGCQACGREQPADVTTDDLVRVIKKANVDFGGWEADLARALRDAFDMRRR